MRKIAKRKKQTVLHIGDNQVDVSQELFDCIMKVQQMLTQKPILVAADVDRCYRHFLREMWPIGLGTQKHFARAVDPSVPADREGYRGHSTFMKLDYLLRS